MAAFLRIHPTVRAALAARQPVVALESTIITHGLPAPANYQTAMALEQTVRDAGAIPATTALIDGKAYVGLESHQIARLAEQGRRATKTSRRDLAAVLAAGRGTLGATTVSGTMILAHLAGVRVFGTGGLGGVHRGGQSSMDVSADLTELSRTPIAVFCSGAKSILDIPRTLEYLETMGVAVHSFHQAGYFPAFYTAVAPSHDKVAHVSSVRDAARIIHASAALGLQSGSVFGVPIPAEFEEAGKQIQAYVEQAVQESKEQGIDRRGKEATPWLLQRVNELSMGRSIVSNRALVMNNVKVAAQVAKELQTLEEQEGRTTHDSGAAAGFEAVGHDTDRTPTRGSGGSSSLSSSAWPVVVVGYAALDITSKRHDTAADASQGTIATTWPGANEVSLGGVGRNMAEGVHRLLSSAAVPVKLVSPVGEDALAQLLVQGIQQSGLAIDGLLHGKGRTASVLLQLSETGDLQTGVADVDDSRPTHAEVKGELGHEPALVALDGNVSIDAMRAVLTHPSAMLTLFEPTSVARSSKIIEAYARCPSDTSVDVVTPNEHEVSAMYAHAVSLGLIKTEHDQPPPLEGSHIDGLEGISTSTINEAASLAKLLRGTVLLKFGRRGVVIARNREASDAIHISHHPGKFLDPLRIVNTTGAGDTFASAILSCLYVHLAKRVTKTTADHLDDERAWHSFVDVAQQAAVLTLQSPHAISPRLNSLSARLVSMAF